MLDLIIRNGRIVTAAEVLPAGLEIGIKNGKISVIGTDLEAGSSTEVVDAEGAYITPGGVDSHAHIEQDNAPTGDTWETGTRSAIAGGNTTVIAFATQKREEDSLWPALEAYHRKADGNSFCDYGIHLIVTNPNKPVLEHELPQLVTKGITSIKLYMTYKPLILRDAELFKIMMAARNLGITTMVHAENNDIIEQITSCLGEKGNTSTYFHAVARPQIAESEATYRAISLAEVTDAPILLVHMSAPTALKHLREAQNRLLPIHGEACPHYLYLTSNKLHSQPEEHNYDGAKHICAPPLRHDPKDLEYLWRELANGTFTVVSSDHAPSTFNHPNGKMKAVTRDEHGCTQMDFRNVPNGLPGIETRLPLIFNRTFDPELGPPRDKGVHISLPRFVALTSTNPAQLYGLADRKGSIQPGFDADIVIWHPEFVPTASTESNGTSSVNGISKARPKFVIRNENLHHRIDYTPFEGMEVRNWPRWVFLRGKKVWENGGAGVLGKQGDGVFLERKKSRILAGQMGRTASGMKDDEWQYWM